jgi:serine phosphatase RsbU (regulator of sigma subunit)
MQPQDSTQDSATLSLEEQIARLQALLEASRQVHSTIAVHEVLVQTAQILVRELEFEGAIFLDAEGKEVRAGYGAFPEPPYTGCQRFELTSRDGALLAHLVVEAGHEGELTLYEHDFVTGLILQASVALENATLHERDLQWARVQQDLDAARGIQRSLLPREMPSVPGFSIAARSVTCYEVGGDYLDVIGLADGSNLLIVADVAGKGLASAIVACSFRSAFRSLATQAMPLAEMAARVGQMHWDEGTEARRRYVTGIIVRLDAQNALLEAVNCGHNPCIVLRPDGSAHLITASGTPLGMLPGMTYTTEQIAFPAGSRLLLYTDGLTEVFCDEDEYGSERLTEAFQQIDSHDAEESLNRIWAGLQSFSAAAVNPGEQTDDMTALAVHHFGSGKSQENFA